MYEFWGWVWFSGELQECRNVFLVLTPNEYERWGLSVGVLFYVNNDDIIGSLSSDVFERRTSTGSKVFSLLTCLDDTKFVFLSFFTVIEAI